MADLNAQASEYSLVREQLKTAHSTQLENINKAFMSLKAVSGTASGFQVENTSAKINKILDTISDDILPALAVVFSESESKMDNFASQIRKMDSE